MHLTAGTVEGCRHGDHGFDKRSKPGGCASARTSARTSAPSPPHTAVPGGWAAGRTELASAQHPWAVASVTAEHQRQIRGPHVDLDLEDLIRVTAHAGHQS